MATSQARARHENRSRDRRTKNESLHRSCLINLGPARVFTAYEPRSEAARKEYAPSMVGLVWPDSGIAGHTVCIGLKAFGRCQRKSPSIAGAMRPLRTSKERSWRTVIRYPE